MNCKSVVTKEVQYSLAVLNILDFLLLIPAGIHFCWAIAVNTCIPSPFG